MVIKFVIDVDKFCEILSTTHFVLQGLCYDVGEGFEKENTSGESDYEGLASQLFLPGVTLH